MHVSLQKQGHWEVCIMDEQLKRPRVGFCIRGFAHCGRMIIAQKIECQEFHRL